MGCADASAIGDRRPKHEYPAARDVHGGESVTGGGHGAAHATVHGPRWLSLTLAVVLGVAAVLAGVTAWKSTVMEGHALTNLTLSTQATNDANSLDQEAERGMTGERDLFLQYRAALAAGQQASAQSILGMMSADTRAAIDWWAAQPAGDRPLSPFVSANPQWDAPGVIIDAQRSLQQSNSYLEHAEHELEQAHNLEFIAALLTIAFLAGGLSGVFESTRARIGLLGTSVVVLLGCIVGTVLFW